MKYFSKSAKREYAQKMQEIEQFCDENKIEHSFSYDSFYFSLNGKNYRVSNHTVEKSNAGAYNDFGEKIRNEYHPNGREPDTIYIYAGKTRIITIYEDLKNGYTLNGKGVRI